MSSSNVHDSSDAHAPISPRYGRWLNLLTTLLLIAWAARLLYKSPFVASNLPITPDEVEYAICAKRLATLGRYDLIFDGQSVPPHSTPWFSCLLAPLYWLPDADLGNGIWLVFAIAIAGVAVLQRIGQRVAGPLAGALVPIAVMSTEFYPHYARSILTDTPAVVIALGVALFYLRGADRKPSLRDSLIAGTLCAAAFALRSTYLALLAPFAWRIVASRERRIAGLLALAAPSLIVFVANALYSQITFADWRRNGYQFWCAVPYDYLDLTLSPGYIGENLRHLAGEQGRRLLVLGAVGLAAIAARRVSVAKPLLLFALLGVLPISLFHLVYFYVDLRFHLPFLVMCAVLGGIGVASLWPRRWPSLAAWLAPLAVVIAAVIQTPDKKVEPPRRRLIADQIFARTPRDAIVIASFEPVYLAALAPADSQRTFIAATRGVEFASKLLVDKRIPREIARPKDAFDHRAPGLLAGGAREAVAHAAAEMRPQIAQWVHDGRTVVFETRYFMDPDAAVAILGPGLALDSMKPGVARVVAAAPSQH